MTDNAEPLHKTHDPRVDALYKRLMDEIYSSVAGTNIPAVAVVGTLELMKADIIANVIRGLRG